MSAHPLGGAISRIMAIGMVTVVLRPGFMLGRTVRTFEFADGGDRAGLDAQRDPGSREHGEYAPS
ncbi:MAG: hypothetical protein QNJ00_03240 [Woeseiaceae bacterium]|nr:hypothetical protein [Woeseiaceae bacterium]